MRLILGFASVFAVCVLMGAATSCSAQSGFTADTIRIVENYWNCDYYYGYSKIGLEQFYDIMKDCPDALAYLDKDGAYAATSTTLISTGTILLGVSLYTLADKDMEDATWMMIPSGLLIICGVEIYERRFKLRNTAVKIFNDHQMLRSQQPHRSLKLAFTPHGVGLVVSF